MFRIQDRTIYMNKGDTGRFTLVNLNDMFAPGDQINFYILEAGNCSNVLLKKTFVITSKESTDVAEIVLEPDDTKNLVTTSLQSGFNMFWYEIELRGYDDYGMPIVNTLVGYGPKGPSLLYMYPEAVRYAPMCY